MAISPRRRTWSIPSARAASSSASCGVQPPLLSSPAMRQLFVDIKGKMAHNQDDMDCLSMGMSGDYADAIAEGSTLVRVGTALFGPRPPMTKQ